LLVFCEDFFELGDASGSMTTEQKNVDLRTAGRRHCSHSDIGAQLNTTFTSVSTQLKYRKKNLIATPGPPHLAASLRLVPFPSRLVCFEILGARFETDERLTAVV
jgi:hypothetical protein